jgi:hypothetical protein
VGDWDDALMGWETAQLTLARDVLKRAQRAGHRSQVESSWQVGEPLPFGLYTEGDNASEDAQVSTRFDPPE